MKVHRSTIGRDIAELCTLYPLTEDEEGGLSLVDGYSLDSITFSSYEVVYVYLACKLITDTLDRHSPYAASDNRKLGAAIQRVSPSLSDVMITDADKLDGHRQIIDKTFISVPENLEVERKLSEAWSIWFKDGEPEEIYPWIHGWGADVEILELIIQCSPQTWG